MTRIAPERLEVRLVGGPEPTGRALERRFPLVRYVGRLDDDRLRDEASRWSAFLHPMFCWARGCSTKLAVALAWGLPIATTPAGVRGYTWERGVLRTAETPEALAEVACGLTDPAAAARARSDAQLVARSLPTVADVAALLKDALAADHVGRAEAYA
jgi:hypothetical protein